MNNFSYKLFAAAVLLLAVAAVCSAGDIKSSGLNGVWSSDTTWVGGIVPGPNDNAIIADGDTVLYDMDTSAHYSIANITVGEASVDSFGVLRFARTKLCALTVTGNILVKEGSTFRVQSQDTLKPPSGPPVFPPFPAGMIHTLTLYGDLTCHGILDFRNGSTSGSTPTIGVVNLFLVGSGNSTITMSGTHYNVNNGELNAVTINKSGDGNVYLGSDVYISVGGSGVPNTQSILQFRRGKIFTGNYTLVHLSTTSTNILGYSDSTYIVGSLGRGMSLTGGSSKDFPIGDENGYRPIKIYTTTGGYATGHHVIARCIHGNANTGSSTLNGNLTKLSEVRYYQVSYDTVMGSSSGSPPTGTIDIGIFAPYYGLDDGIRSGNEGLRVAYSLDNRASWTQLPMLNPPTTSLILTSLPKMLKSDTLNPAITFTAGSTVAFAALADTDALNPLDGTLSGYSADKHSIAFGNVLIGREKEDSVVFTNTGTGALTIRSISTHDTVAYSHTSTPFTVPVGESRTCYFTFHPDSLGLKDVSAYIYHDAPGPADTLIITANGIGPMALPLSSTAGWNMLSNPLDMDDETATLMFPGASSQVFKYSGGSYVPTPVIHHGLGHWLKFSGVRVDTLKGGSRSLDTVDVGAGWNMIGSLPATFHKSGVIPVGTTITSSIFGFTGSYTSVDSIQPGKGYWVKVSAAGKLYLSFGASATKKASPEPGLDGLSRLIIRDAAGNQQRLYFTADAKYASGLYELPPAPPQGMFDARFTSNRFVEIARATGVTLLPVQLSAASYPLTVSWSVGTKSVPASLVLGNDEVAVAGNGSVRIDNPETALSLKLGVEIPKEFALGQNYPNPFNPSTRIAFMLPAASTVTLRIFNLLGQEVASPLNQKMYNAGAQEIMFDASLLPTGVYMYRMDARALDGERALFSSVKKMVLVK